GWGRHVDASRRAAGSPVVRAAERRRDRVRADRGAGWRVARAVPARGQWWPEHDRPSSVAAGAEAAVAPRAGRARGAAAARAAGRGRGPLRGGAEVAGDAAAGEAGPGCGSDEAAVGSVGRPAAGVSGRPGPSGTGL